MGKLQNFFKFSVFVLSLIVVFGFASKSLASNEWRGNYWYHNNYKKDKKPLVYLFATKYAIKAGEATTMYWDAKRADSCSVSGSGWGGSRAVKAEESVSPSVTTKYTITCTNEFGSYTDSAKITVMKRKGTSPNPDLTFTGSPLVINQGDSSALTWSSSNATLCEASGGWSGSKSLSNTENVTPNTTTVYTLACGNGVSTSTKNVTITVNIPQPQLLEHLIISEVYYDVGEGKGDASRNEWMEVYNGTGSSVDMSGWVIADASSEFDLIPAGTVIPNLSFVVITAASTTSGFWGDVPVISLETARLGNSFGNSGDSIYLKNAASTTVDSLSYGNNIAVFDPAISIVNNTGSIKRINLATDTNTASDWATTTTPTPGSF